jgi:hypothetical protein
MSRATMPAPLQMPDKYDDNGVRQKNYLVKKVQAKLSHFFYSEQVPMPTAAEIEEAQHHEAELTAERDTEITESQARALAPHD